MIEKKNVEIGNYNKKIAEYEHILQSNTQESETYRMKLKNLTSENTSLGDEVRTAQ